MVVSTRTKQDAEQNLDTKSSPLYTGAIWVVITCIGHAKLSTEKLACSHFELKVR